MIVFGRRASTIGKFDVQCSNCSYCEEGSTQRVSVFGEYVHIYWVPVFPIGRKATAECTNCKKTIEKKEFSKELKKQYQENKSKSKRPIWHWLGSVILGILVSWIAFMLITTEDDPRRELLNADIALMVSNPTMETDSISYKIKRVFDDFATADIDPRGFKYLTKIQNNRVLVLVQIPQLRSVQKEERVKVLKMIQLITDNEQVLKGMALFIGVKGAVSMMLIKTPMYENNSRFVPNSELYEFYGGMPTIDN